MENRIKAIETYYNGYRFRSRLEARWAVFFDTLGVSYEYEPEGFRSPNGICYLTDFKIKCYGKRGLCHPDTAFDLFVEVKGLPSPMEIDKIRQMSRYCPVLVVGQLPPMGHCCDSSVFGSYGSMFYNYSTIDGDDYGAYPAADANGRFYLWGADYVNSEDIRRVENAYNAARQARFESYSR